MRKVSGGGGVRSAWIAQQPHRHSRMVTSADLGGLLPPHRRTQEGQHLHPEDRHSTRCLPSAGVLNSAGSAALPRVTTQGHCLWNMSTVSPLQCCGSPLLALADAPKPRGKPGPCSPISLATGKARTAMLSPSPSETFHGPRVRNEWGSIAPALKPAHFPCQYLTSPESVLTFPLLSLPPFSKTITAQGPGASAISLPLLTPSTPFATSACMVYGFHKLQRCPCRSLWLLQKIDSLAHSLNFYWEISILPSTMRNNDDFFKKYDVICALKDVLCMGEGAGECS